MKITINVYQNLIRYYIDEIQPIYMRLSLMGTCWGPGFVIMIKKVDRFAR